MVGFADTDAKETKEKSVLNPTILKKEKTKVNKFIVYNQGQTAGSFIISILQKKGIPCVDELFNKEGIYPGKNFSKVFRSKKYIYSIRPGSIKEAFDLLQKCKPLNKKYLGMKICGRQRNGISDFEEILKDKDILKIFLYRKNEIKLYLTRFFYNKLKKGGSKGFPSMFYDPDSLKYYQVLKSMCEGKIIKVECEDFFDFRVNSVTKLCQLLDLNDIDVKYLAVNKIVKCLIKPLNKILTESELIEMEKFFNMKYPLNELANKKFRDCRDISLNLGFL
jgi:hypothetical protein